MNVLQIANGYYGSRLYDNLFASLENKKVTNTVVVPIRKDLHNIEQEMAKKKYSLIDLPCYNELDRYLFFPKQEKILKMLEDKVDIGKVSLIHAHTLFSGGYAAYRLHEKYGIPYVVAVRNTDVNTFFKWMFHLRHVGVNILKNAGHIVFLSPAYQKEVLSHYVPANLRTMIQEKCVIIPNGIDDFWHRNLYWEKDINLVLKKINDGEIQLLYAGAIDKNKNLPLTLEALRRLSSEGFKVRFHVIGKILERRLFERLRKRYKFDYVPAQTKERLIEFYRGADIFVMPSHTETFGLVYAEALTQGLPVLYTRGQGFDGQFEEGFVGYAVSDKDPDELVDKIKLVMRHYQALSWNCLQAGDKFKWDTVSKRYIELYSRLVNQ